MSRVCPNDGAELTYESHSTILVYYHCPKCGEHFKGFIGDSDEPPREEDPTVV